MALVEDIELIAITNNLKRSQNLAAPFQQNSGSTRRVLQEIVITYSFDITYNQELQHKLCIC